MRPPPAPALPEQFQFYSESPCRCSGPSNSYAPVTCYTDVATAALNGPGSTTTLELAAQADYGLLTQDLPLLTEGAIGPLNVGPNNADQRITNYNVTGPYPLVSNGNSL